jgi:fatty acid desaturase
MEIEMIAPLSFYRELQEIARRAYREDRQRVIRDMVEIGICFAAFIAALWLAGIYGWGW